MKKQMLKKCVLLALMFGSVICQASDVDAETTFAQRYNAWKLWVSRHPHMSTYIANQEFRDIVALGIPAIPFVMEKVEKCPEDFELVSMVGIVSRRRFRKDEWPQNKVGDVLSAVSMYLHWWRVGRFQTGEQFRVLYGKWKALRKERKDDEAGKVFRRIVDLGIPVLPDLMEIVDVHPEFIAAVSELSGGELPPGATSAECKEWWAKNRDRFTLPGQQSADTSNTPSGSGAADASKPPAQKTEKGAMTNATERAEKR